MHFLNRLIVIHSIHLNMKHALQYANEKVIIRKHVASAMQRLLLRVSSVYGTERTIVQNFGHLCLGALYTYNTVLTVQYQWFY